MEGWIETKLENSLSVPKPVDESQYSGKFVFRIPNTLHAHLAMEAENGWVAFDKVCAQPDFFDLIFMDICI